MSATPNPNRIDPTPARLSTNLSIERQTPKTDFGDRVKLGLDTATGAVANGAAAAAPFVPGGAIVSAAVSSVTQMSDGSSSGQQQGQPSVSAQYQYAAGGVTSVPSGGGDTNLSTTIGGTSLGGSGSTTSGGASVLGTGQTATEGQFNGEFKQYFDDNMRLLRIQTAMQHETQVFQTVSNVLKVRHDTVKNTIGNVR
jgi:hypothetical protein